MTDTTLTPVDTFVASTADLPLLELYEALLVPRLFEERMLLLLKQNKISKWFSGIGQEAISVGATLAMLPDEYILPAHRNLGVFTARKVPLDRLFAQFQGKNEGFTKGRDRSFHFGAKQYGIVGMISHMAAQLPVAAGVALAHKIRKENKVVLAFCGEGATSEGDFHEAVNTAATWQLPVIFIVENNGWSISTPNSQQFACESIADKAVGYGIESFKIDGNNSIEVYQTVKKIREDLAQNPRTVLIEAVTYRMRGHEEASGTAYMPEQELNAWKLKDPILHLENILLAEEIITVEDIELLKQKINTQIRADIDRAFEWEYPSDIILEEEINDIFAPSNSTELLELSNQTAATQEMRFIDAISDTLRQAMITHPELILMGQDIAEYGGVFKITDGFLQLFGKERVRNTPLCESAIVGIALGLSVKGFKSVVEMQYADFVSCAFNQIVNNLAKSHYRWAQPADVVIRMPTGAGVGAGPFHSQSTESWFAHVPGLKIVYPAFPDDVKGLLNSAIDEPNPIMFFEHKALYRSLIGSVPTGHYVVPIGKARLVKEGHELSVITYGMGVHWAIEITTRLGIAADVLDLRTIIPYDKEAIAETVKKTGKVLVCHEDTLTAGIGAEIAAWIAEYCFTDLDAPVMREASADLPVPFAAAKESVFLPIKRIEEKIIKLKNY